MIYNPPYGTAVNFHMNNYIIPESSTANYRNLIGVYPVSKSDLITKIRDFICKLDANNNYSVIGIGWEVHDASYAADENNLMMGDWFVIKSTSSDGMDLYFRIEYADSNYLTVLGFQSWNADTHTGINQYGNAVFHIPLDDSAQLWIYGDLSSIAIITKVSTTYYAFMFGRTKDSMYSQDTVASVNPVNPGNNQWIEFDKNASSFVDDNLFIYNDTNIEITPMLGMDTETRQMQLSISNSYPDGLKAVPEHGAFVQATNDFTNANNFRTLIADNGNLNAPGDWDIDSNLLDKHNPEELNDDHMASSISLSGSGFWGRIRNVQVIGFMTSFPSEELLNDRVSNWRLFNVNGFNLLFKEV